MFNGRYRRCITTIGIRRFNALITMILLRMDLNKSIRNKLHKVIVLVLWFTMTTIIPSVRVVDNLRLPLLSNPINKKSTDRLLGQIMMRLNNS